MRPVLSYPEEFNDEPKMGLATARLRRDIARGDLTAGDIIFHPPPEAQSVSVREILTCQPGWGRTRATRFLAGWGSRWGVDQDQPLASLNFEQRFHLAVVLNVYQRRCAAQRVPAPVPQSSDGTPDIMGTASENSGSTGRTSSTMATELVESGSDIAGAAAAGALGLIGGAGGIAAGSVGGVVLARTVKRIGTVLQQKWLDPCHAKRAGAAYVYAAQRISERMNAGEKPRNDGFFEGNEEGRSAADALLDGVLSHAAETYEEQKIRHIGYLYASIAFRSDIPPAYANLLLKVVQELTYRQLVSMTLFGNPHHRKRLDDMDIMREEGRWGSPAAGMSLEIDGLVRLRLIGLPSEPGAANPQFEWEFHPPSESGLQEFAALGRVRPTRVGRTLFEIAELHRIPEADRLQVLNQIADA
jgi:hypothetical protein